jgi:hypothetical protein
MDSYLANHVGVGDATRFILNGQESRIYGSIYRATADSVDVVVYTTMSSAILQQFLLLPVQADVYPMASQSCMVELIATEERRNVPRSNILDVIFILPVAEVESGLFFMDGAGNSFFLRYVLQNGEVQSSSTNFFMLHIIQPICICLFHSFNYLAQHLKRSMFHQTEAETSSQNFRIYFSMEAFFYLSTGYKIHVYKHQ